MKKRHYFPQYAVIFLIASMLISSSVRAQSDDDETGVNETRDDGSPANIAEGSNVGPQMNYSYDCRKNPSDRENLIPIRGIGSNSRQESIGEKYIRQYEGQEQELSDRLAKIREELDYFKNAISPYPQVANDPAGKVQFDGPPEFKKCQELLGDDQKWERVVSSPQSPTYWGPSWKQLLLKSKEELDELHGEYTGEIVNFFRSYEGAIVNIEKDVGQEKNSARRECFSSIPNIDQVFNSVDQEIEKLKGKVANIKNQYNSIIGILKICNLHVDLDNTGQSFPHIITNDIKNLCAEKIELISRTLNKMQTKAENVDNQLHANLDRVRECAALAATMKGVNFSDEDAINGDGAKSMDGLINCKTDGVITVDFTPCKKLAKTYDACLVAQKATETVQGIRYQYKAGEAQIDASSDPTNPTAALVAQKKMVEEQARMAKVRGGVYIAKLAALSLAYSEMPEREALRQSCQEVFPSESNSEEADVAAKKSNKKEDVNNFPDNTSEKYYQGLNEAFTDYYKYSPSQGQVGPSDGSVCDTVVKKYPLIKNLDAKDVAKGLMIKTGVDVAKMTATAVLLEKQAQRIQAAIDGIKNYDPSDLSYTQDDLLLMKCQINPMLEECAELLGRIGTDFYGNDFSIAMGEVGQASTMGYDSEDGDSSSDIGQSGTGSSPTFESMGSIADAATSSGGSQLTDAVGAASVKAGKASGGGAGGGAGAASVGAPSGGGSGGEGKNRSNYANSKINSYDKGKNGTLTYGKGGGVVKSKSKSDNENPFSKLLGKNGDVLGFRNPASVGKKDGASLFEKLSSRYGKVSEANRLLIYEIPK